MSERKLKAKCVEKNVSANDIAQALNLSKSTYYRKLSKNTFTVTEVMDIAKCLSLSSDDVLSIFFDEIVA